MRTFMTASLALSASLALAGAPALAQPAPPAPPAPDPRFEVETLAEGLTQPWGMAFLPDGSILLTEKPGRLRIVRNGRLQDAPVWEGPEDLFYGGQGGLLDITLHPDFASNGLVYMSYSAGEATANATSVVRGRFNGSALSDVEKIFSASPIKNTAIHFGGRLQFLPDDTFLLTVGDGFVWRERAQRLTDGLGKIVRLNDDGSIPDDNPFVGEEGAHGEIFTRGHRNLQGLAYDEATGRIFETEHGPWGGDELNVIEAGNNYGWPVITWGTDYNGAQISPFREYPGMEQPKVDWTPVIAASGLAVYHGDLFPDWEGDILAGGLGGFGGPPKVVRVRETSPGVFEEQERILQTFGRVRDVTVGPDGAIYLLTDASPSEATPEGGRLLRVTPASAPAG